MFEDFQSDRPFDVLALPVYQVVPTLRTQITEYLSAAALAVGEQDFDNAITQLHAAQEAISLLQACVEEMEQS